MYALLHATKTKLCNKWLFERNYDHWACVCKGLWFSPVAMYCNSYTSLVYSVPNLFPKFTYFSFYLVYFVYMIYVKCIRVILYLLCSQ